MRIKKVFHTIRVENKVFKQLLKDKKQINKENSEIYSFSDVIKNYQKNKEVD